MNIQINFEDALSISGHTTDSSSEIGCVKNITNHDQPYNCNTTDKGFQPKTSPEQNSEIMHKEKILVIDHLNFVKKYL